jgi:hypothetical protein
MRWKYQQAAGNQPKEAGARAKWFKELVHKVEGFVKRGG